MAAITKPEILPGLSAFLDIKTLKSCPGCLCNARQGHSTDRNGPFLILSALPNDFLSCVPLYSKAGIDKLPIDKSLKSGPGKGWKSRESLFCRNEFWKIPVDCYVAASKIEINAVGHRQSYGIGNQSALDAIMAHEADSDAPYQPFSN